MADNTRTSAAASETLSNASQKTKNQIKTKAKANRKKKTENTEKTKQNNDRSSTLTGPDNAWQKRSDPSQSPSSKCKKSLGVRVIRGRIYDSENGKSCHQCRQKTSDFSVSCKNQSENKQCTFHFCHICLLNRYGEKAEEMAGLGDWKCPRCRGICNCSQCMKKRGCCPTGRLVDAVQATGFSSVSEMLQLKESEEVREDAGVPSKKETASNEEGVAWTRKRRKENGFDGGSYSNSIHNTSGDDEKNENPHAKRSRRNDGREDSKKITKDEAASPKKLTSSKKGLPVSSTRGCQKGNYLDGVSHSKVQPKPLKLYVNENESQSGKLKKLGWAYEIDDSKPLISKRVPPQEGKTCSRDDDGLLKKMKSDKQCPKKSHKRLNKVEDNEAKMTHKGAAKYKQVNGFHQCQKKTAEVQGKVSNVEFLLPPGIELTSVSNIDLPAEDIGHALQFLEFCEAFAKVLDLKKGQPECLLRELAGGQSARRSHGLSIVQFHIKLLSVIQKDSGKEYSSLKTEGRNSWLLALNRCISESHYQSKELLLDCFNLTADGYGELSSSLKLRLLNFLCDEALGTEELRSWIDEKNLEFVEEEKKVKERVLAKRQQERNMKMKLQDEMVRVILTRNGAPLSVSEYQHLVLKIKAEAAQNLVETLEDNGPEMEKIRCC